MKEKYLKTVKCFSVMVRRNKTFWIAKNEDDLKETIKNLEKNQLIIKFKVKNLHDSYPIIDDEGLIYFEFGKDKLRKSPYFTDAVWQELVNIEEKV